MRSTKLWPLIAQRCLRTVTPAQARAVLEVFAEVVRAEAASGGRVLVPGLGVFRARRYRARVVAHEGQHHQVPGKLVLTFRAAKASRVLAVEEG